MRSLFVPQFILTSVLLLLTLLGTEAPLLFLILTSALIGTWLLGAIIAPFSLLLSALTFAGTVGVMGLVHIYSIPFSVNGLLTVGLGAACGLAIAIHYREQFRTVSQLRRWLVESLPFSLLLAMGLVRTLSAPVLSDAISDILIWSAVLLVYVLARAYWTKHPEMLPTGEKAFVYIAFLPPATIVIDALLGNVYFNTNPSVSLGLQSTSGARSLPIFFGLALAPLLTQLRTQTKQVNLDRKYLLALSAVLFLWVYFSLARMALLATGGIVLPLTLFMPRALWKAAAVVIVAVGLTAAVIQSPLFPRPSLVDVSSIVTVEEEKVSSDGEEGTSTGTRLRINKGILQGFSFGRTDAWEYLIETGIEEKPLLRFGTGASRSYVKIPIPGFEHPHNDYIRVFFDFGIIGLIAFLSSWVFKLLTLWKRWTQFAPTAPMALHSFVALTAAGYVLLNAVTDNPIVYFFVMGPLALLIAMADATAVQSDPHIESGRPGSTLSTHGMGD